MTNLALRCVITNVRPVKTAIAGLVAVALLAAAYQYRSQTKSQAPAASRTMTAAVSVRTAEVTLQTMDATVQSRGTVQANEFVEITAQVAARVTAIHFKEGSYVERGATLVELDSAEARAELAEAEAAYANSKSFYERSRALEVAAAVSQSQLQQLEANLLRDEARVAAARARLANHVIKAPFSGFVGLRRVSVGAFVTAGTTITTLDDISRVKIDFSVPEFALPALQPGLEVVASSPVYPGRSFVGHVDGIDPRLDASTRSIRIRASFPNADRALAPGMFMAVALVRERFSAPVVLESAVIPEQGKQYVFVVDGTIAARRQIELGQREPGRVQVLSGLLPGERVVIDGALKLRDGAAVKDVAVDTAEPLT
jgi:membrane fusion protein (multidrug efflux system)